MSRAELERVPYASAIDAFGRTITVEMLTSEQEAVVRRMGSSAEKPLRPDLVDTFNITAAVRRVSEAGIDSRHFEIPKCRSDLDLVLDVLDNEGIEAARRAYIQLTASN